MSKKLRPRETFCRYLERKQFIDSLVFLKVNMTGHEEIRPSDPPTPARPRASRLPILRGG